MSQFHVEEERKPDQPDEFAKYHNEIRTKHGQQGPAYKSNYRLRALEEARSLAKGKLQARTQAVNWVSRGPGNVPGRTRGLIVDASDPTGDTWFAGTAGGGVWKTTNAGTEWINKTPDLPNLAVTTLAQAESNPSVIYAGTGEGFFNSGSIDGNGLFKSIDGGETWTQLTATTTIVGLENVNRIIVDPANENIVLACGNGFPPFTSGIYKSVDGGANWTMVYEGRTRVQHLITDPNDFQIQYAAVRGEAGLGTVVKSVDGGDTWSNSSSGLVAEGRIELAIAPTNSSRIFAAVEGSITDPANGGSDIFISDDAGASWALMLEENNGANPNWLGQQGWYDNAIMVHPFNDDFVYVGGIDVHRIEVKTGSSEGQPRILGVTETDTESFIAWVNWGGTYLDGGFDSGEAWFSEGGFTGHPQSLSAGDMASVEIRFGPGKKQMAHRFTVSTTSGANGDGGAGVPPEEYAYQDYVEVPFEVWDVTNNRQLMVSFRDQERDGAYDLNPRDDVGDPQLLTAREYIFVNAVAYSSTTPDNNIAQSAGHSYKNIYAGWPILAEDGTWDPENLPESQITANYGAIQQRFKATTQLTNSNGSLNSNLHPDQHNLLPIITGANTFKILSANDGGVHITNSADNPGLTDADWTMVGRTMVTGQFYGVDKRPGISQYFGGLQDNGSQLSSGEPTNLSSYSLKIGGDGFDAVWHYTNELLVLGSNQFNGIQRSTDGGFAFGSSIQGLSDRGSNGNAPFITKLANSKKNPDVVYTVGASGVWRSNNFGEEWFLSEINNNWIAGDNISSSHDVEISEANRFIVWAGGGMTDDRSIFVSRNGGINFNPVPNSTIATFGGISGLATHPVNDQIAYVLFSIAETPKILRTTDLGQTWEDISGFGTGTSSSNGFPDVAVHSLLVLPHEPTTIWAGTEIGIVESTDDGATWHFLDSNLPAVSVWEIKAVDNQIVVATHGRGIWSAEIDGLNWPGDLVVSTEDGLPTLPELDIYPNPAWNVVNIEGKMISRGMATLLITDLSGRTLKEFRIGERTGSNFSQKVSVADLQEGIYIVTIRSGEMELSKKLYVRN